jgi:ABC-2 type transport system permease protein
VRLLQAELLKIRTAPRTAIGLLLALLGLVGLGSGATARSDDEAPAPFAIETSVSDILDVASIAVIFALILGILAVTWEYRHGTITSTFLATPRRERVIGTKLVLGAVAGALLAVLSVVVSLGVASFWIDVELERDHWELIGRIVLGTVAWAVLGVGVGALIQSQVGAIVAALVWFLVAEPLLGLPLDEVGDYLPGAALDRLMGVDEAAVDGPGAPSVEHAYSLGVAALLTIVYAAGFALLGIISAVRRDVP